MRFGQEGHLGEVEENYSGPIRSFTSVERPRETGAGTCWENCGGGQGKRWWVKRLCGEVQGTKVSWCVMC
jgi:hypothetical protein